MAKIFKFKRSDTGEVIKQWKFNPSQEKFWNSKKRFVLFSGGFGCGKSMLLILKAIVLSQKYNGNYILMGRKTYPELRDALIKDFFNLCPEYLIDQWLKAETRVIFKNKSEIIFRHLDTVAESEIRSMNLGAAFIDQAEDISEDVFMGLQGRLRREGVGDIDRRIYLSCNPKLTWLYKKFKREPGEDYDLIEASTLENAANLSPVYIDNLMKYPASYRRQYVEGVWDESLFSDRIVFAREYVERIMSFIREPIKIREGLEIFAEYKPGHKYQMGVDAAEGIEAGDEAAITIADLEDEEEVASWSGRVPPDVLAMKAAKFARWYQDKSDRCVIVPEMNSIGLTVVHKLKQEEDIRVYRRQEFDKVSGRLTEKLGWRTTSSTKPLLVSRFNELLRLREPRVFSAKTVEQFKSFVYTDEVKRQGMGSEEGFHDDRIISLLLAFWQKGEVVPGKVSRPNVIPQLEAESHELNRKTGLVIVNGKIKSMPQLQPKLEIASSWTIK